MANKYNLKCVLINPAVQSSKTLKRAIDLAGVAKNYYDDSSFSWNASHLDMLKKYTVKDVVQGEYLLLLQKGDDVLDYRDAVEKIPDATLVLEEGGTHPFEAVERHFKLIRTFLLKA